MRIRGIAFLRWRSDVDPMLAQAAKQHIGRPSAAARRALDKGPKRVGTLAISYDGMAASGRGRCHAPVG